MAKPWVTSTLLKVGPVLLVLRLLLLIPANAAAVRLDCHALLLLLSLCLPLLPPLTLLPLLSGVLAVACRTHLQRHHHHPLLLSVDAV